jgi:hypothetical protein
MQREYYYYIGIFILSIVIMYKLSEFINTVKYDKKEGFTNDNQLIDGVLKVMDTKDIQFAEYINFIRDNKVTNLKLINNDVFYEFKALHKLNLLTRGHISGIINA